MVFQNFPVESNLGMNVFQYDFSSTKAMTNKFWSNKKENKRNDSVC